MLGLAISGGGLKAIGEIGAMKAFEGLGIKFDVVAGTSSGSSVAALYSLGYTADEGKKIMSEEYKKLINFDVKTLLKGVSSFALTGVAQINGLIDGNRVEEFVTKLAEEKGIKNTNELSIPAMFVSVDTITTNEIVFASKKFDIEQKQNELDFVYDAPIGKAVRASMAFPGIFTNCDYDKYNLIDGGTKNNLPTEPLRAVGVDKVISLSFKLDEYVPKDDLMAIIIRTCDIFSYDRMTKSRSLSDIDIIIDVPHANLLDVSNVQETFDAGYNAVMNKKEEILALISK